MNNIEKWLCVSKLIFKDIIGSTSEKEKQELEVWRSEKETHEKLYHRLNEKDFATDYRKQCSVNPVSPMHDMQKRIAQEQRAKRIHALRVVSSVAAVITLGIFAIINLNTPTSINSHEAIKPGKTQAILTLGNGERIALDTTKMQIREGDVLVSQLKNQVFSYAIDSSRGQNLQNVYNQIDVPRGGEFDIELQDGTRVWLNSESTLRYPVHFSGADRTVILDGEAYFEVQTDKTRPFIVISGRQTLQVLGTKFNISAYSGISNIYTTLVEGKVQVTDKNQGTPVILSPGEQVVMSCSNGEMYKRTVDADKIISWRSGWFVFENQTLDQIMQQLARWYDFIYFYQNKDVADIVLTARFERFDNVENILILLEETGHLKFERKDKTITVIAKERE